MDKSFPVSGPFIYFVLTKGIMMYVTPNRVTDLNKNV